MRHLWSLLAGIVAAPLTWVLVAAGQSGSSRTVANWTATNSFNWANLLEPAVYLLMAGILLGLLGTLRFSPAGPLAAGLLLVTPYAGLFVEPFVVRDWIPANWRIVDDELPLHLPLDNGTLLFIGTLLLMAAFSVQRWRRWPTAIPSQEADTAAATDERSLDDWPPRADKATETSQPATEPYPLPRRQTGARQNDLPGTSATSPPDRVGAAG